MNDTELYDLLKKMQDGDMIGFEALLDQYAPLVDSMTRRFLAVAPSADADELRQEASLALYRAAMHFDVTQKNVQFGLFAKTCIQNALASQLRTLKKQESVVLLEDEFGDVETDNTLSDPASRLIEEESYMRLYNRILGVLSESENRIWWLYLSGYTAREIAKMIGKDEKSVQNSVYRIRRKLREIIPYS